ncbi:MAG: hypothetical protein ACFBQW_04880 [Sphingomonadaceae bacterium]
MRHRHDGFTAARRATFLATLRQSGCVRDACRVAGISSTTAYRSRKRLPEFAAQWDAALALAGGDLELLAYDRAVRGTRETIIRDGKVVAERIKPSDGLLKLLLQGAMPDKYGRPAGRSLAAEERDFQRRLKAMLEAEMSEEQAAELEAFEDWRRLRAVAIEDFEEEEARFRALHAKGDAASLAEADRIAAGWQEEAGEGKGQG